MLNVAANSRGTMRCVLISKKHKNEAVLTITHRVERLDKELIEFGRSPDKLLCERSLQNMVQPHSTF